ncbi:UDP-N-acetylglucosamine 2-epimerase (non-hydrolyzing) [Candidatus Giovannonibacteria bacterium]|nr:UDP-N-acetylglucosamine 2-epimerase (non-hydrolyzing) [Candidatus Giovannonibacteria bacterium]
MKLGIILGTRPEIIKMSPVIHECLRRKIPYFILHTGQHYSPNMDRHFFKELLLPQPHYNLGLGALSYRKQVGFFIKHISAVLKREKPDAVIVEGDTVTVVAGALAANKLGIKVAHHEAGLRSHDITMLEEVNRVLADHVSTFLFAPTRTAVQNLIAEGFDKKKIFLTGNTIVDVVKKHQKRIETNSKLHKLLKLKPKKYFLITAHRAENVDRPERLKNIFEGLKLLKEYFKDFDIIYPMHPRTAKKSEEFGIKLAGGIKVISPVGYFDMLSLQKGARLVITDSGGVQEEACILKVPAITIRDNTERPETVKLGMNALIPGVEPVRILTAAKNMLEKKHKWQNPFGDGRTGQRIVGLLTKLV